MARARAPRVLGIEGHAALGAGQDLEHAGYQFEAATASFELLLHEEMGNRPKYYDLDHYRCVILKRDSEQTVTEAIVKANVGDTVEHRVADGDGPVNALDNAFRNAVADHYPGLEAVHLTDYKVRVLDTDRGTGAVTRVLIDSADADGHWTTIGVSENIIEASWLALRDALVYALLRLGAGDRREA